jgi:toxin FitB
MNFLVDANVLSEPTKLVPEAKVVGWLNAHEGDLVVDPVVLGEVFLGIFILPRGRKRSRLEAWLKVVAQTIECVPWDAAISRRWAQLVSELQRKGRVMPLLDSMIAATALEHNLTIATRNVRDFQPAGVKVFDPFAL